MKKIILLVLLTGVLVTETAGQVTVRVTGSPLFNTSGLMVTEAGLDFPGEITETVPATTLNIEDLGKKNRNYVVYASLSEMQGTISLKVKRLSAGTLPSGGQASGKISGGETYIPLTTTPVPFFEGKGERINIQLGFALENLSVTQPAGNLPFAVIFTAVEK